MKFSLLSRRSLKQTVLPVAAAALTALLTGCGANSVSSGHSVGTAFHGHVFGGQQPVTGASIFLYAAGSGSAASSQLTLPVFTDVTGSFTITADYTCPSATAQMYLVSRGGNPGLPGVVNNAAETMMAPLGDCQNLQPSTNISLNEVTTVASAWALAQFADSNASFSASTTNATGLRNAMLVANNLVDVAAGSAGGATLPTGATFESAKLNTLADILAVCINSDGGAACTPLFSAATVNGTAPTNTLDAALNIVRNPAQNVAAVFNTNSAQPPFQPTLVSAPNDWTMTLTYTGGGLSSPTQLGIDSAGNVWAANYYCCATTKLSPNGQPASATGFINSRLNESFGIAIDGQDNAWVTVEESPGVNSGLGSLAEFSSAGAVLSGNGFFGGGVYYPYSVAVDTDGSIWIPDYGNSHLTILNNDGTAQAGYAPTGQSFPINIAMDGAHNAWLAIQGAVGKVTASGTGVAYSCCSLPTGVALDLNSNVWVADYRGSAIVQLTPAGVVAQQLTGGGVHTPENVVSDGAGNIWVVNYLRNSISGFSAISSSVASSTALSPATGFGPDSTLNNPFSLTVDASGNIWVSNFGSNSLTQFVGLAAPRKTPLLGLPATP